MSWAVIYTNGGNPSKPNESIEVLSSDQVEMCRVIVTSFGKGTGIALNYTELNEFTDALIQVRRMMKTQRRERSNGRTEPIESYPIVKQ